MSSWVATGPRRYGCAACGVAGEQCVRNVQALRELLVPNWVYCRFHTSMRTMIPAIGLLCPDKASQAPDRRTPLLSFRCYMHCNKP